MDLNPAGFLRKDSIWVSVEAGGTLHELVMLSHLLDLGSALLCNAQPERTLLCNASLNDPRSSLTLSKCRPGLAASRQTALITLESEKHLACKRFHPGSFRVSYQDLEYAACE